MVTGIIDERTLAGWLSAPTEARAASVTATGADPLVLYADVEEHVRDVASGLTKRCDLTLRSKSGPLATAEMKRPEVAQANSPALQLDAWKKAVARGLHFFLTCNFREVAAWETEKGPYQQQPRLLIQLVPGLRHSSFALSRRNELVDNWRLFLDAFVPILQDRLTPGAVRRRRLPPQAIDLREAIQHTAQEAASRIREAAADDNFRRITLEEFRSQFGVEISLDPMGNRDRFFAESEQVATISCFVVATRLMLYQALVSAESGFGLDELDILRSTSDPTRVSNDLANLYDHARRRTQDFEVQFHPSELDDIVFVDAPSATQDVGQRWGRLIDVIRAADWQGPATYVPGLYESLLDDEHRHVMGVHYTPDSVAEIIAAYVVRDAADIIIDPASGAGTFVSMCYNRKRALGSNHEQALQEVYAVELADFAASLTGLNLTLADSKARSAYPRVFRSDFFDTYPGAPSKLTLPTVGQINFPANIAGVVGNPPYIRFENRTPHERLEILRFLQKHYNQTRLPYPNFTGKADVWAFFVVGAHMYLREGGRLGFVLSWNLLASDYGDAVLSFLGRYFAIDAIIDSRVERWFAAKQNTLILLARKAADPVPRSSREPNTNIATDHLIHFIRLKQPVDMILDQQQPRGKRAEDVIDELLDTNTDVGDDLRWDVRVFPQRDLVERTTAFSEVEDSRNGE